MERTERPHQDLHLIEIWGPSARITSDKERYHQASNSLMVVSGFTIMEGSDLVFQYPGQGFTYMAALSESGVMGHTWPGQRWNYQGRQLEYTNYLLHTCKPDADFSDLADFARVLLEAEVAEVNPLRLSGPPINYHPSISTGMVRRISAIRNR